jgi:hypothetical protein
VENDTVVLQFLDRHTSSFPYREQLLECLNTGESTASATDEPLPVVQLLDIYQTRLRHLRARSTSELLVSDVDTLVTGLNGANGSVMIWSFQFVDGRNLLAFETLNDNRLIGVVRSIDARIVSHDQLDNLWSTAQNSLLRHT